MSKTLAMQIAARSDARRFSVELERVEKKLLTLGFIVDS